MQQLIQYIEQDKVFLQCYSIRKNPTGIRYPISNKSRRDYMSIATEMVAEEYDPIGVVCSK